MKISVTRRGLSIRKINIIMLIITIVASVALVGSMMWTKHLYQKTRGITQDALEWRGGVHLFIDATDYMTEQMRSFVITGKKDYLDNYMTEVNVTKRRDKALETVKEYKSDSPAYKELCKALEEKTVLMEMEYYAARLTVEIYGYDISTFPDEIKNVVLSEEDAALSQEEKDKAAENMLFGEEYLHAKDSIVFKAHECIDIMEDELITEQADLSSQLKTQMFIEHILTFLYIVIMLSIVFVNKKLVIEPLKRLVGRIREGQNADEEGAYEIRFASKTYNLIYNSDVQNKEKVSYDATHDKLTGLYNREGFDFLGKNVDIETTSLLILNVDDYKKIVDENGSDFGDRVLYRASGIIFRSFRSQDYICRLGEDEFAVIMINSGPEHKALITSKVASINEQLSKGGGEQPPVSVSVGVAFGAGRIIFSDVLKQADKALEKAKSKGKNTVVFSGD
ncbi:MAG: GGDEF domain-containing protein [Eubacterium sp.]|nr:GGDEF domain-containing protein [Eubacterium sp.]